MGEIALSIALAVLTGGLIGLGLWRSRVARTLLVEALKHPTRETVVFPNGVVGARSKNGSRSRQQEQVIS